MILCILLDVAHPRKKLLLGIIRCYCLSAVFVLLLVVLIRITISISPAVPASRATPPRSSPNRCGSPLACRTCP